MTNEKKCCEKCLGGGRDGEPFKKIEMCLDSHCICHADDCLVCSGCVGRTGCHNSPQPTLSTDWEVTLADEGTPLARFQKERTDAMSEMFDNKFADGIYPTSKLFARLDDCVRQLLTDTRTEAYEKGQDDAFAGRIENMRTLEIKETVNIPEALREHFRKEGRTDERRKIAEEVKMLKPFVSKALGRKMIDIADVLALLTKDPN